MTLRARLALGFLAIVCILALPLLLTQQSLGKVSRAVSEMREGDFNASLALGRARSVVEELQSTDNAILFVSDSTTYRRMTRAVQALRASADSVAHYGLTPSASELRRVADTLSVGFPKEFAAAAADLDSLADTISVNTIMPALAHADSTILKAERELEGRTQRLVTGANAELREAGEIARWGLVIAVLSSGLIAALLVRSINRPIRDLMRGMQAVADGHFGHRLSISSAREDEFGRLAASYRSMARQLAELDKLKAEFVSVASHELKTPINVILGYLQLLEEGVYGPLNPRQQEIGKVLEAQGQSLARLAQQLLDISRFEAGGGKLELGDLDLGRFLDELEQTFRVLALQRDVEFDVRRSADLPTRVHWDEDRMKEVLGNLLSNAFKFTDRGGRVQLDVDALAVNVHGRPCVHMEVRDTGAGIPESQLPHVFRKFYQADNQAAAAIKGTGLGLAIAKEIVELHGGRITVESERTRGTTFSITLPADASARGTARVIAPPVPETVA